MEKFYALPVYSSRSRIKCLKASMNGKAVNLIAETSFSLCFSTMLAGDVKFKNVFDR
jgi:hypothetical protein